MRIDAKTSEAPRSVLMPAVASLQHRDQRSILVGEGPESTKRGPPSPSIVAASFIYIAHG